MRPFSVVVVAVLALGPRAWGADGGASTTIALDTQDAGVSVLTPNPLFAECPEVDYADGGHAPYAFPFELHSGVLTQVSPDGGNDWVMPFPRPQRVSCMLAACESRDEQLEVWRKPVPAWVVFASFALGIVAAGFGAFELCTRTSVCGK